MVDGIPHERLDKGFRLRSRQPLRIIKDQHGGFRCRCHDGIFELDFGTLWVVHLGRNDREGSGNDGQNDHGEQFLTNAIGGFATKPFDLEHDLLASVRIFHGSSAEAKLDDFLSGETALVVRLVRNTETFPSGLASRIMRS